MVHNKVNDTAAFLRRMNVLVGEQKMSHLDAIMQYCEETGIEVEYAATLVKRCGPIQQNLEAELIEARVLPSPRDKAISLTNFMLDD